MTTQSTQQRLIAHAKRVMTDGLPHGQAAIIWAKKTINEAPAMTAEELVAIGFSPREVSLGFE